MIQVVVDNVCKLLFCHLKLGIKVFLDALAKDAKKHVRPASRSADMLQKTDDRSDVYYGSHCRQNPRVSFLSN